MSHDPTAPSDPDPSAEDGDSAKPPAALRLDEYLTSGRRFVRWNLVTLVLGLVALTVGLLVVKQQRAADAPAGRQERRQGAGEAPR